MEVMLEINGKKISAQINDADIAVREAAEWLKVTPLIIVIPCGQCMHWTQFSMEKADNYGLCCHEHTPCFGRTTEGGWFCGSGEKEMG